MPFAAIMLFLPVMGLSAPNATSVPSTSDVGSAGHSPPSHAGATPDHIMADDDFGLTGDWWGLRNDLRAHGIDIGGQATLDNIWNTTGGAQTGYSFISLLEFDLGIRTEPLLGLKGGRFKTSLIGYTQTRSPEELVPAYVFYDAAVSGIGDLFQIAELSYEQKFFDELASLRFGKIDANDDFAVVPGTGAFLNSATTYPGTIAQYLPTYPYQAVGLEAEVQPLSWLVARFGWFDGSTNYFDAERGTSWPNTGMRGPKNFFDNPGSWFFIGEVEASWTLPGSLPGTVAGGWWWQTGPVEFDVIAPYVVEGSEGAYVTAAQTLFNLSGDQDATRRIMAFSQFGFGEAESNPATFSALAGISAVGLVPGREDDQLGIQWNYLRFTHDPRVWEFPDSDTVALEAFYRIAVTKSISVQPDIQWISRPNGSSDLNDAFVVTLRVQMSF